MLRMLLTSGMMLIGATTAMAHFVFLVPEAADPSKVKAIFSDSLKPDDRVDITKIEATQLQMIDATGKVSKLKWTLDKAGACYKIEIPGSGVRTVFGTTEYGVLQRGNAKPFRLIYHSKAIMGGLPTGQQATQGVGAPLEVVPIVVNGKLQFQALWQGKPLAKAEFTVMVPEEVESVKLVADDQGLTKGFEKAGTYGVYVRLLQNVSGEFQDKKYEEIRQYATLVFTYTPGSASK